MPIMHTPENSKCSASAGTIPIHNSMLLKFHSSSSWGIFLLIKCKIILIGAEVLPVSSKWPRGKHQWCYRVTVSVQTWVLSGSACAFQLCLLDHTSAGTRAQSCAGSCQQHILLRWIPIAIFQTVPASIADWVCAFAGSCKSQTVHSSSSAYKFCLTFLLSNVKSSGLSFNATLRQTIPSDNCYQISLSLKKKTKQCCLLTTIIF